MTISDIEALQGTLNNFIDKRESIPKALKQSDLNGKLNNGIKQHNVRLIIDAIIAEYAKEQNWRSEFINKIKGVLTALTSLKKEANELEKKISPL